MPSKQQAALDPAKRKELVWKMQEILHRDVAYIVPFYAQATQAYRTDRFTGWITDQPKVALEDPTSLLVIEPVQVSVHQVMSGSRYLLTKIGWAILTIVFVVVLNFFLFRVLPGDPARAGIRDPRMTLRRSRRSVSASA